MLEVDARRGDRNGCLGWVLEVGHRCECLGWLIVQSADCPEAKARHGQTGGCWCSKLVIKVGVDVWGGSSRWVIEVNAYLGWVIDQSADCPEAEARHGQTG